MKRLAFVLSVVAVLGLGFASQALSQRGEAGNWQGSGGWGMGMSYQRLYDPSSMVAISGIVESVGKIRPRKGMNPAIALTLKTDKETLSVHLGPEWYIGRLDARIEKGDKLEIKGSRITLDGKPVVIAAEVKKGENTLVLRDSAGVPMWAGWRR
jgi:hypothetical protein